MSLRSLLLAIFVPFSAFAGIAPETVKSCSFATLPHRPLDTYGEDFILEGTSLENAAAQSKFQALADSGAYIFENRDFFGNLYFQQIENSNETLEVKGLELIYTRDVCVKPSSGVVRCQSFCRYVLNDTPGH